MGQPPSTIERALELARAGTYTSVADIKRRLVAEGYGQVNLHLSGSFAKQLRGEIAKLKAAGEDRGSGEVA